MLPFPKKQISQTLKESLKKAVLIILFFFAFVSFYAYFTKAHSYFSEISPFYFFLSGISILLSVFLWVWAWMSALHKKNKTLFAIGFFSAFASLTPVQFGADIMRAYYAKKILKIPFTKSISSALLVKGIKFLFISVLATFFLLNLLLSISNPFFKFIYLTGFLVVLLATLFFLLPLNRKAASFFSFLFGKFNFFILKKISSFFKEYHVFFSQLSQKKKYQTFVLAFSSFFFEFLALYFIFLSLPLPSLDFLTLIGFFVLISVLERSPFFPKGIGIVEILATFYLSLYNYSLSQTGAIIVLYSFIRIIVPYLPSLLLYLWFRAKRKTKT